MGWLAVVRANSAGTCCGQIGSVPSSPRGWLLYHRRKERAESNERVGECLKRFARPAKRRKAIPGWLPLFALCAALLLTGKAPAAEEVPDGEETGPRYRAGIVGVYQSADKSERRLDEALAFDWGQGSPSETLPGGRFDATWSGDLFVRRDGTYRFAAYLSGTFELQVAGKPIIKAEHQVAAWVLSEPVELEYGYHALEARFAKTADAATIKLCWQSSAFDREVVPPAALVHIEGKEGAEAIGPHESRAGEQVVRSRRCAACHELPLGPVLEAPSLVKIAGAVRAEWLAGYLQHPSEGKSGAAMPEFGLSVAEAKAVAAYLWARSEPAKLPKGRAGDTGAGQELFEQVGCLACHTRGNLGQRALFGGGDLARIAAKRPAEFFDPWLRNPEALNRHHRMPVFELSREERRDLTAYLASLGAAEKEKEKLAVGDPAVVALGRRLIEEKRCAHCHEMVGIQAAAKLPRPRPGDAGSSASIGCLGDPDGTKGRPGFRLEPDSVKAVLDFLANLPEQPVGVAPMVRGEQVLEANNCLACHARGASLGLREVALALGVTDSKKQAALVPPSLSSVGDKLEGDWLAKAVGGEAPRLRPWLSPRMPRFRHKQKERAALVDFFRAKDFLPEVAPAEGDKEEEVSEAEALLAAPRLLSGKGFGCVSCHQVGSHEPTEVEPGARGSDLRHLGRRMRREWFRRWTRDPARLAPGTEMPAITLASPGVLGGRIDAQLDALWLGLNAEELVLPSSDAVQTLVAMPEEPVVILRDVFEHAKDTVTARPFAIALANGHNLLVDLDTLSVRRWWVGDFARQRTRGKSWYWECGGPVLGDWPAGVPALVLVRDGMPLEPLRAGPSVGRLRWFERDSDAARLSTTIDFPEGRRVAVEWTIRPHPDGIRVDLAATGVAAGEELAFRQADLPPDARAAWGQVRFSTSFGMTRLAILESGGPMKIERESAVPGRAVAEVPFAARGETRIAAVLFASAARPPAAAPAPPAVEPPQAARRFETVPGYETTRLPVPTWAMPTGIAWRGDGAMLVTELKGSVLRVLDSDGDGDPDQYRPFADHLSAPFGILVEGEEVLVCHKPELLRLVDRDGDGRAERSEVVASGWGVTSDYHDWSVGPVRGADGALYLTPACQQDSRSPAAAAGRGKVLRIGHDGIVSEFAAGIRFAMGIAASPEGEIFTTDNQGVTNPFNELNHIRPGRHYGFFSKLEKRVPGTTPVAASIQIPHPWSRSVNGIAFVPPGEGAERGAKFGPFAGHLIGAEYTTRGLVRLSLQPVGDTFQGCAYPFSDASADQVRRDETFLGPVAVAFGPDGALYVGSMIDSGWGGGNNRGTIERVRWTGSVPFGIREVRAHAAGFDIDFTGPADRSRAADSKSYTIDCYQRIPKGGYETPDQDRARVTVEAARPSGDGRSVRLTVRPLRPGFVYDIAIGSLGPSAARPFPAVAYYTLNEIPSP